MADRTSGTRRGEGPPARRAIPFAGTASRRNPRGTVRGRGSDVRRRRHAPRVALGRARTGRLGSALPLPELRVVRRDRGGIVSVLRRGIRSLDRLGAVGSDRRVRRRGRCPGPDLSDLWRRDGQGGDEVRDVRSSIHTRRTRTPPRVPAEPRRELAVLSAVRRIPLLR